MFLLLLACAAPPEGLRATPDGTGPLVTVDCDAKPLADIPFPNDLATRADFTSPTGLRLNIPLAADTNQEAESRAKIDQLTGFGIYSPLTVGFQADLDLDDIVTRHRDDPLYGDARFGDDAIYVVNVDPDSPDYGRPVAFDLGEGRFPMDAARGDRYFPNDTRATSPSLVFDTVDEDVNQNGLSWYERTTHTLVLRPNVPLREETTYAIVLTERLVGEDGAPVRSPWEYVNHLSQTEALRPLEGLLPTWGLTLDDVAFAWTFTTGRVTSDLVDIHRGLEGEGHRCSCRPSATSGCSKARARRCSPPTTPRSRMSWWAAPSPRRTSSPTATTGGTTTRTSGSTSTRTRAATRRSRSASWCRARVSRAAASFASSSGSGTSSSTDWL